MNKIPVWSILGIFASRQDFGFDQSLSCRIHCIEHRGSHSGSNMQSTVYITFLGHLFAAPFILHSHLQCNEPIQKVRNKYCDQFIYSHERSAYSAVGNVWTDPGNIQKSLLDTRMWKLGLSSRNQFPRKGIHKLDFRCSVASRTASVLIIQV